MAAVTLANKITLLRIVLIPLFAIGLMSGGGGGTLGLFAFLALTDVLDGIAARVRNQRTVLGTFLDPLADKFLLGATFLILAYQGRVPTWAFVLVFSRDLAILLGWTLLHILADTSAVDPRCLGKAATVVQMLTVVVHLSPVPAVWRSASLVLMAVVTAVSALDYVWVGGKKLSRLG
jgi:cardiolipin synthase